MSAWDVVVMIAAIICVIDLVQRARRRIGQRRRFSEYNDKLAAVHGLTRKTGESNRELRARMLHWTKVRHGTITQEYLIACAMNVDLVKRVELGEAAGQILVTVWPGALAPAVFEVLAQERPAGVTLDVKPGD